MKTSKKYSKFRILKRKIIELNTYHKSIEIGRFTRLPHILRDARITVVKNVSNADIHGTYPVRGIPSAYDTVDVGMEFKSKGRGMPSNFCSWAWADIQRDVAHLVHGEMFLG